MTFRPLVLPLSLPLPAASVTRAAPGEMPAVVSGTELEVHGGERVRFRLDRGDPSEAVVRVRLRFTSRMPRGRLEVDGVAGPDFPSPDGTASFRIAAEAGEPVVLPAGTLPTVRLDGPLAAP